MSMRGESVTGILSLFSNLNLFTINTWFLSSQNIYSLHTVLPSNNKVLQLSKVRLSATTHFFVPLQSLSFNFLFSFLYTNVLASSSRLILPITLFFPTGSGMLSSFEYPLVLSTLSCTF